MIVTKMHPRARTTPNTPCDGGPSGANEDEGESHGYDHAPSTKQEPSQSTGGRAGIAAPPRRRVDAPVDGTREDVGHYGRARSPDDGEDDASDNLLVTPPLPMATKLGDGPWVTFGGSYPGNLVRGSLGQGTPEVSFCLAYFALHACPCVARPRGSS